MEIIKVPKRQSKTWGERLVELEVGESFYVEVAAAPTISSRISALKTTRPDWNWTVRKVRDPKSGHHTHATVTRTA